MRPILMLLLALAAAALLFGCGSSIPRERVITIRDFDFEPDVRTVTTGDEVTWANADSVTHRVVSGELLATAFPTVFDVDVLQTEFAPDQLTVALGDSVRIQNSTQLPVQIEVKERDLDAVFLSAVLQPNETTVFTSDKAGRFRVRDAIGPTREMQLTILGTPDPDGLFASDVLDQGENFKFTFTAPGTFTYFCSIHSFENGTVVVNP